MADLEQILADRLTEIRQAGLHRELISIDSAQGPRLTIDGHEFLNFSSNDYLGLANHNALREAAAKAATDFGAGTGASRLICGSLKPHQELEESLAAFKGTEAALSFSTGYAAAIGAICAIMGKGDVLILDKLVHASIVDAARLSGATLRVFRHNDLDDLQKKLNWATEKHPASNTLIVTESVFSMDGDLAPLLNIVELKEKHGAWLMADEAHATGLYGEHRRGLIEEFGLTGRVEIQMATLGKAVGAAGGVICGSRSLIDLLINKSRPFIYSTAPTPATVAAARAGIEIIQGQEGEQRRQRLWALVDLLKNTLVMAGLPPSAVRAPIIPTLIGDERAAVEFAKELREQNVFVPAIRYPTVARKEARLRFTISAGHTVADLEALTTAFKRIATDETV